MPKVYVTNKSGHDFGAADEFGELIYLSEGRLSKYATNNIYRTFTEALEESTKSDWLVVTGLTIMNMIAASILAFKHGQTNYLIYNPDTGDYVKRTIMLDGLIKKGE